MSAPLICLCVLCRVWAILRKDLSRYGHFVNTLDKFDIAILNELQADARLTNAELAQRCAAVQERWGLPTARWVNGLRPLVA